MVKRSQRNQSESQCSIVFEDRVAGMSFEAIGVYIMFLGHGLKRDGISREALDTTLSCKLLRPHHNPFIEQNALQYIVTLTLSMLTIRNAQYPGLSLE